MLKIKNLSKTYKTGKEALHGIDLVIKEGEFTALLGPNGAGKTTLINILAGNVIKTTGTIVIGGFDLDKDELKTKKVIGVVPQEITFDSFFSLNEVLANQSGYFGITDNQKYIDELLEALALTDKKLAPTRALSGGMRRRLLIAKALVHKPKLLILDEPTAGVDIELRQQLYAYLKKLHNDGTTIILTTHYLEEAEKLCKRIVIINEGKIIADDTSQGLIAGLGQTTLLEFFFNEDIKPADFSFLNNFKPAFGDKRIHFHVSRQNMPQILAEMVNRKVPYSDFQIQEPRLEDVFLKLTR